jgi:hypothetical protein
MNLGSALLWGFVATIVLTTLMAAAHALRMTRMSIPFLLGTMFTPDRGRARLIGFMAHLMNGWVFALVYALAFESWGRATWWLGAGIGVVHALFVLVAAMPLMPGMHPRMASEERVRSRPGSSSRLACWRSTTATAHPSPRSSPTWPTAPSWAPSINTRAETGGNPCP